MRWCRGLGALAAVTALLLGIAANRDEASGAGQAPQKQQKKGAKSIVGTVSAVSPASDTEGGDLGSVTVKAATGKKGGNSTEQKFTITKDTVLEKGAGKKGKGNGGEPVKASFSDIAVGSVLTITPKPGQATTADKVIVTAAKKKGKAAE